MAGEAAACGEEVPGSAADPGPMWQPINGGGGHYILLRSGVPTERFRRESAESRERPPTPGVGLRRDVWGGIPPSSGWCRHPHLTRPSNCKPPCPSAKAMLLEVCWGRTGLFPAPASPVLGLIQSCRLWCFPVTAVPPAQPLVCGLLGAAVLLAQELRAPIPHRRAWAICLSRITHSLIENRWTQERDVLLKAVRLHVDLLK